MHVAALEKDPKHFQVLTLRLTAEASYPVKALKQAADRGETCELCRTLAVGCTRLIRDRHSHFVQTAEEVAEDDSAPRSSSSSSAASGAERKCPVRGQALALKPEAVCVTDECSFGDGSCWPLSTRLQLQESILLKRAHATASVRDLIGPAGTY